MGVASTYGCFVFSLTVDTLPLTNAWSSTTELNSGYFRQYETRFKDSQYMTSWLDQKAQFHHDLVEVVMIENNVLAWGLSSLADRNCRLRLSFRKRVMSWSSIELQSCHYTSQRQITRKSERAQNLKYTQLDDSVNAWLIGVHTTLVYECLAQMIAST